MNTKTFSFSFWLLNLALCGAAVAQTETPSPTNPVPNMADAQAKALAARQDPKARALLDAAKAKLLSLQSLRAEFERGQNGSAKHFDRQGEVFMERPNKFRVEGITGAAVEERTALAISDGQTITTLDGMNFIALEKQVRAENFFLGINFLVQFFFDPRGISFDPSDATWGRPISQFDTNASAYDRDTRLTYLGTRTLERRPYEVVEIKYNTYRLDIRQQIYVGEDKLIYQVDTYVEGTVFNEKYRNFKLEPQPADLWKKEKPDRMPSIAIDPVRLGAEAPDFTLPGHDGGEFTLKGLLNGKKGLYVCVLDGAAGRSAQNADYHLAQMRILQDMKNKFEKQGLAIVCIIGGSSITPDLKDEMLLNWLPDLTRFNYPIVLDLDLERGLQGSAFHNFQLNGRNNLLLDAKGRVVFGAANFGDKVNELMFYQSLAQIGFSVSPADLEGAAR